MVYTRGIAIDDMDNINVSSNQKMQKFTSSGECVDQEGSKEGEFNSPCGLALHNNQVYIFHSDNHRIQVFDLDLNFIQSIGSHGKGRGEFDRPVDVKFDTNGYMYVAIMAIKECKYWTDFIRRFGEEGKGKLSGPIALHIVDKYVYVSDFSGDCIVVYETSGRHLVGVVGKKESSSLHAVSPHVLMVLYMYVIGVTTEFRYYNYYFGFILLHVCVYLILYHLAVILIIH